MSDPFKTLRAFGLPDGAIRPPPTTFDADAARWAVRELLGTEVALREREVLAAWLSAFRHHWPRLFTEVFGQDGDDALRRWTPGIDPNRYLKLRRIAVENLSHAI